MDVCVVVPWRPGCPHRDAAFAWARPRWPWPVVTGETTGPWCKAAAVDAAIARTDAQVLVVADADVWCSAEAAVAAVLEGARWAVPHRGIRRLGPEATLRVLAGAEPELLTGEVLVEAPTRAHPGGGIVVVTREAYELAPLDRRFVGWGHEDDAWGIALRSVVGRPWQGQERLWHLWHPPQDRQGRRMGSAESLGLWSRYARAQSYPRAVAQLVEEARCARRSSVPA